MSKTNEKTTPAQQTPAASGAGDLAVVQSAPATTAPQVQPEQDRGRGGFYTNVNGVRQRVDGTERASVNKDKAA